MRRRFSLLCLASCLLAAAAGVQADEKKDALLKQINTMLDKALKAYNDNDAVKFYADFLKNLREKDDLKEDFAIFFHDENKEKYGKYKSRKINDKDTVIDFDENLMVVHYKAEFEKNKKVNIVASLGKEDGKAKFKLIQFIEEDDE